MKRIFITIAAIALTLISSFAFSACATSEKVSVKEIELTSEEYAFAIRKGNSELLDDVNGMLAEWKKDGSLEELITSYFDGDADFTYSNKTSAPREGDFVVATNAYFPPFESYAEDSSFCGVDIEIAYNIATELGRTLYVKDMEFDSIIPEIQSGSADIGMAGMTVNDERKMQVDFADGYYTSAQVIAVRATDTTFDSCKSADDAIAVLKSQNSKYIVGTQAGTTGYMYSAGDEDFGYEGFANLTTKAYSTGALAMQDLSNGRIDAVILDKQPSLMISESLNARFGEGVTKTNSFQIFWNRVTTPGTAMAILNGLKNTLIIAVLGLVLGFVIGCVLATLLIMPSGNAVAKGFKYFANLYIAVFRGTPMMVQLLLMHFAVFASIGIQPVIEVSLIFGFNSGAYMAEILRGGINAVDKGQMEAGRSVGLSYMQTMMRIVLPQAVKNILPTLGNEFIALIKETSVVSFITVIDIYKAFQSIANSTYEYIVPYLMLALVYLVLVIIITLLVRLLERRLRASDKR